MTIKKEGLKVSGPKNAILYRSHLVALRLLSSIILKMDLNIFSAKKIALNPSPFRP